MTFLQTTDIKSIQEVSHQAHQMTLIKRKQLDHGNTFFQDLMCTPLKIVGKVYKNSTTKDIHELLVNKIHTKLQVDPFYKIWLDDMAKVCEIFCETLESEAVSFYLGTQRSCRRYHVDNVPLRLLVTYAGLGTEWIPDDAADRLAFESGAPNEEIIKDPSKKQFINTWDIAIFQGGPKGLLHRTPDEALKKPSVFLRLDHSSFWDHFS
ncbi:MAG: hypothetical protein CMP11_07460 [Zetaproteobacteria bacterium]|nr:hypothetical protein [Pseudobdellovibrionaceae bacterium]